MQQGTYQTQDKQRGTSPCILDHISKVDKAKIKIPASARG